jgi:hypothetical protein
MTEVQREFFTVLPEVCLLSPDVRLGQLFANLGFLAECHVGKGLGDVEDDELVAILYRHRAELLARLEGVAQPEILTTGAAASVSGSSMLSHPAIDAGR